MEVVTPNAAWDSALPWTGGMQLYNCSMIQHPSLQCSEAYAPDSQTHFRLFWLNQRMLQVGRARDLAMRCCCFCLRARHHYKLVYLNVNRSAHARSHWTGYAGQAQRARAKTAEARAAGG